MKRFFIIFLLLLLATSCFARTESFGPEYDSIVKIFQSEEEPDAMDAIWESQALFKIGVFKHGRDYDQYANHACDVIEKNGFQGKTVAIQIVDLKKLAETDEWVILGEAQCR
ncbi:MAG: hypothetical protein J7K90_04020 [Desulfuromusa sp.]|nr:hypothetical protein [Desulfuromusa sp.]